MKLNIINVFAVISVSGLQDELIGVYEYERDAEEAAEEYDKNYCNIEERKALKIDDTKVILIDNEFFDPVEVK